MVVLHKISLVVGLNILGRELKKRFVRGVRIATFFLNAIQIKLYQIWL